MTKNEYRAKLKLIYPKAARGNRKAIDALALLMKQYRWRSNAKGYCLDCGILCRGKRCLMHFIAAKHTKKKLAK